MAYDDPRLAVLYDIDNPDGPGHDFFRALADARGASDILDLGCGTGILTVTRTAPGRTVTGIEPDPIMLERARSRAGGDRVTWVQGTAEQIAQGSADLIVMSGNVTMHIVQEDWPATLEHIARGLRAGGALVFESRNPEAPLMVFVAMPGESWSRTVKKIAPISSLTVGPLKGGRYRPPAVLRRGQ